MFLYNKFFQFYVNNKKVLNLIKNKEIPLQSIYKSKLFKNMDKKNISFDDKKLFMSSNNSLCYKSRIEEFNKINYFIKDYENYFFNHAERDKYMKEKWSNFDIYKIYISSCFQQMKADIFRYCFILDNGGYWLDVKSNIYFDPKKIADKNADCTLLISPHNLESIEINNGVEKFTSNTKYRRLTNWFIGGKKDSDFIKCLISNIVSESREYENVLFEDPKDAILNLTGPKQLTRSYLNYNNKKSVFLIDELEVDIEHESKYGRKLNIFDNVFIKHYSEQKNKVILKAIQ